MKSLLLSAFVTSVWSLLWETTVCFLCSLSLFGVLQGAAYHFESVPLGSLCMNFMNAIWPVF